MRNWELDQWFSTRGDSVPRQPLATSVDNSGYHLTGGGGCYYQQYLKARDAAKYPIIHRTTPHNWGKGLNSPKSFTTDGTSSLRFKGSIHIQMDRPPGGLLLLCSYELFKHLNYPAPNVNSAEVDWRNGVWSTQGLAASPAPALLRCNWYITKDL